MDRSVHGTQKGNDEASDDEASDKGNFEDFEESGEEHSSGRSGIRWYPRCQRRIVAANAVKSSCAAAASTEASRDRRRQCYRARTHGRGPDE
jgi:hypothetical protein